MPPFPSQTKVIAHRGGVVDDHRSENSFAALEEAIRRRYTHVEIDARITGDGHVVCFHNDALKEEAGVDGKISEMSVQAVTQTTLTRSQEKIPTFEAYCERCEKRIGVMIDLKGCTEEHVSSYAQTIEDALVKYGLLETALILINKYPVNNQDTIARHFLGKSKISWRHPLPTTQNAAETQPNLSQDFYIFNHAADFTQESLLGYQALGLEVIVSINTHHYKTAPQQGHTDVKRMLEWGTDGLQIDSCYDNVI